MTDLYNARAISEPHGKMPWLWLAMLCAVVALMVLRSGHGAEIDRRPKLWIYSRSKGCEPCKTLKREVKEGKALFGFRIEWLDGTGYTVPCIYYRLKAGGWGAQTGWSEGNDAAFRREWKSAGGR